MTRLKIHVIILVTALVLAACGGGGSGSSSGGGSSMPAGTFVKTIDGSSIHYTNTGMISSANATAHWQNLYLAGAIAGSGNITGISFQYSSEMTEPAKCTNVTIKLSHSSLAALSDTFAENLTTGQGGQTTVLLNAAITFPAGAAGTWHEITFSTPFKYNGVDNLIVEFNITGTTTGKLYDDLDDGYSYYSTVWSKTSGATTGTQGKWLQDMRFAFSGGDNRVTNADWIAENSNYMAPGRTGRTQMLVLASDINGSGLITGLAIDPQTSTASADITGMSVKIAHLPASTTGLTEDFEANYGGVTPVVVTQDLDYSIPEGQLSKVWIPFNKNDFNYDGTSNLLIDISCTVSSSYTIDYKNVPGTRVIIASSTDATAGTAYSRAFEPVFRFYGAQVTVLPDSANNNSSGQVLGSSAAGQAQSLYRSSILGSGGKIASVYVRLDNNMSNPAAASLTNYKLYMGHTTKTAYDAADTYASNMDGNTLVFSGTLSVPSGLYSGDWVKIKLSSPFTYDPSKNLSVLFTTDAGPLGNIVSVRVDSTLFPKCLVGRNDNSATTGGTPSWEYPGIVDLALDIVK